MGDCSLLSPQCLMCEHCSSHLLLASHLILLNFFMSEISSNCRNTSHIIRQGVILTHVDGLKLLSYGSVYLHIDILTVHQGVTNDFSAALPLWSMKITFFKLLCSEAREEAPRPSGGDCVIVKCCPNGRLVQAVTPWGHSDYRCTVCAAAGGHHLCCPAAWALSAWWQSSGFSRWWVSSHANNFYHFWAVGRVCRLLVVVFFMFKFEIRSKMWDVPD